MSGKSVREDMEGDALSTPSTLRSPTDKDPFPDPSITSDLSHGGDFADGDSGEAEGAKEDATEDAQKDDQEAAKVDVDVAPIVAPKVPGKRPATQADLKAATIPLPSTLATQVASPWGNAYAEVGALASASSAEVDFSTKRRSICEKYASSLNTTLAVGLLRIDFDVCQGQIRGISHLRTMEQVALLLEKRPSRLLQMVVWDDTGMRHMPGAFVLPA
jgi:hypothetical protein